MSDNIDHIIALTNRVAAVEVHTSRIPGLEAKLDMLITAHHERRGASKYVKTVITFIAGVFGGTAAN
jgi:hypothetical protein